MAKKNRDLFEILDLRRRGAAEGGKPSSTAGNRRKAERTAKSRAPGPKPAASGSGLLLAGIAFACLAIGFLAGRMTGPAGEAGPEKQLLMRNSDERGTFGLPAGSFGGPDGGRLSAAELRERLSTEAFPLATVPIPSDQPGADAAFEAAERTVLWAREQGFDRVRLRRMRHKSSGNFYWLVLDYVEPGQDVAVEHSALSRLESPDFAPNLAATIAKVRQPIEIP